MRKSKFFLVVCTTVINAKFLHNVWASEKLKSSLIFIFFTENNSQSKKSRSASASYLPGLLPPQLNFDDANLIFIEDPENRSLKIENFKLKVFFFSNVKFFACGGQISKVLFWARKIKISKFDISKAFLNKKMSLLDL